MICDEPGVLENSEYFFFTPTELFEEYYYHILVCGHFFCDTPYSIRRNTHLGPLILFMNNGELHVEYQGEHLIAKKNDLILLNCDYPHAYYCNSPCEFHFFHIGGISSHQLVDKLIQKNHSFIFRLKNYQKIQNIMEPLISKMYFVNNRSEPEQSAAIYQLLFSIQSFGAPPSVTASPAQIAIENVALYMRSHPEQNFTIQDLARLANMSPYYFSHQFKVFLGSSPITYMSNLKTALAKNILLYTNTPVCQISQMLGYSSSASFINAFKSRVGNSPNAFRHNATISS